MSKVKTEKSAEVINVVDEFDYSTQSATYNERFRKWRQNKQNSFAYNFTMNKKESVYIDGKGFVNECNVTTETKFLSRLLQLIGVVLLIIAAIDTFFGNLLVQLLDWAGVNVHNSFYNSVIYGGYAEVAVAIITITLLKLIVPMIFVHKNIKMPARLGMTGEKCQPPDLLIIIAFALIIGVVMGIPSAYTSESREIYAFFKSYQTDASSWGQTEYIVYTIFDVLVVSILFELLFRGEMFQALRQYGDIYAVIISSIAAGAATLDLRNMPGTILISAVASIGVLRTGSLFAATTAHIVYKVYMLALLIIEMNLPSDKQYIENLFMMLVFCLSVLTIAAVITTSKKVKRRIFAKYTGQVPRVMRISQTVRVFAFSATIMMCLIVMIVKLLV